jgi:hypothetical protein
MTGKIAFSPGAIRLGGLFERGQACFDVFKLDSPDGAIKYKLGRPESDCRGYIRIGHKLQGDCASSASRLLHPRDGLNDPFPARPEILRNESWLPHPSAKRFFCHPRNAGCVFDARAR